MNILPGQAERRRDHLCLALLWIVVTAYNLFKAYHIDDTAYLEIAKWISGHPLHPMSGLLNWQGIDEPIFNTNQPHLYFYLIAIWSNLFGFSEPALHSLQSIAALACILLFYRLARFFASEIALWLTAIMILGPAFVVEQNLMVDVPLLALWLGFFCLLACGVRYPNQTVRYFGAALACSAALLIKYSSLVLIPMLCLSLALERRGRQAWTVLVPIVTLAAWSLFNYLDYGAVHILTRPPRAVVDPLAYFEAWVLTVGGLTPLGLIALVQSHPRLTKWGSIPYFAIGIGFAALVGGVALGRLSMGSSALVLWWAFLMNGAIAMACLVPAAIGILRRGSWNRDGARAAAPVIYLVLWVVGTTTFYLLFSRVVAPRHVLLILPPLLLIAGSWWNTGLARDSAVFGLMLTVVISTGLCVGDWRAADFARSEALRLHLLLPKTRMVWTSGHWGWQWYAALADMRQVDVQNLLLQPGDYLVVAQSMDHQELRYPPPMHLVRVDMQGSPYYDLFCNKTFYDTPATIGPWFLSRICRNRTDVFSVDGDTK